MKRSITIKDSIKIKADSLTVWNFTQDFKIRSLWDRSVNNCIVQQRRPNKVVKLSLKGGIRTNLYYKLCRKPTKTSLKLMDTKSLLFKGGGGSWTYNEIKGQTQWTQTNTLVFKYNLYYWIFSIPMKIILRFFISASMKNAKDMIENKFPLTNQIKNHFYK